ncbi:MAG TPA: extracellular solute-binding protein [Propionibacteriaceae bacterium]|nr:extracellular solute-binding protein [Propionibacteriaceae bacterium]
MSATNRRSFLALSAAAVGGVALSACGTAGPGTGTGASAGAGASGAASGGAAAGTASMWALSGQPNEGIVKNSVDAFNAKGGPKVQVDFFQNDAYKQKIRTAIGAGQAPTLIYGWGGGGLRTYAAANQVEDLTSWVNATPAIKDRYINTVWNAATVNGKIFALAGNGTQPIILWYNKAVFDAHGAQPPTTWADLMKLVTLFNSKGVAPFSLGGQSRWTSMMWLQYLLDRIGGPTVFQSILEEKKDAWSDPAVLEMAKKVVELVQAKAFISNFASVAADGNADQALLWTGKAAMMLHGGWTYGSMKANGGDFVSSGKLGWTTFPTIAGGKGDIKGLVGNPANYWSISSKATAAEKEAAKAYLKDGLLAKDEAAAFVKSGTIPVVKGVEAQIDQSADKPYLSWVYARLNEASSFTQSWDQALQPTPAEELLKNIEQLFLLKITPEQFVTNMNATIGK